MKTFYHLDSTRVTIREHLLGTPFLLLPIILIVKLFRIPLSSSTDDPPIETLAPFEVDETALPADVRQRFAQLAAELTALGFHSPIYHAIVNPLLSTRIYWATYIHNTGLHVARIQHRIWTGASQVRVRLFPVFCTAVSGGTFLVTSGGKPDMLSPKSVRVTYHPGFSTQKLWDLHQTSVQQASASPYPVRNQDELRQAAETWLRYSRDFHIARGVFKPLREEDRRRITFASETAELNGLSTEETEVYSNLLSIQQRKTNPATMIPLLLVSLLLFVLAGRYHHLPALLLIVPILGLHELGHYLTMRAFKYRNLNVFFIPFLGAAVTGQHYNVPGWKKSVVSLAGPAPGIFAGIVIGMIAVAAGIKPLLTLALMMLGINAFNLLPILPLDGGWILHSVLFSRHPYLDTAFRVVAVVGLFLIGIGIHARVLAYVCIPMAMSIPSSWREANTAYRLLKSGVSGSSPDNQTVPLPTARAILQDIRATQPRQRATGLLAQQVLNVFGTLNSRPPGALASLALIAVHLGAFIVAIITLVALAVASRGISF